MIVAKISVATNESFRLRSIDIRVEFLLAKCLDREVFMKPPREVKRLGKIWKFKKPLYGLYDASHKFWLKVREVFDEIGIMSLKGDESLYYCHNKKRILEGMIFSYVDVFILAGDDIFLEEIADKIKNKLDIS